MKKTSRKVTGLLTVGIIMISTVPTFAEVNVKTYVLRYNR